LAEIDAAKKDFTQKGTLTLSTLGSLQSNAENYATTIQSTKDAVTKQQQEIARLLVIEELSHRFCLAAQPGDVDPQCAESTTAARSAIAPLQRIEMPTERLSMRHIREVLRLHHSVGMSQRAVARSLNLAQGTVSKYLNRTRRAGLTWPLPQELDDDVRLEERLYPPPSDLPSDERPQPDWAADVVERHTGRLAPKNLDTIKGSPSMHNR
jgi:hypothetical protein